MKKNHSVRRAFTFLELLIVLSTIAILFGLLLPAVARSRIKSTSAGCLNNLRQMMVGWSMYKDNNNDTLLPNAPIGVPENKTWCGALPESWGALLANTNRAPYLNSLLAPYIANRIELYHCPGDTIPSDNGLRIRSYSMNGQMGSIYYDSHINAGWRTYAKGSELTCPAPKDAFVFADESMATMNDGFLQLNLNSPDFPDCPANYHEGAGSFSFADGHAELHRWTPISIPGYGLLSVPYRHGVVTAHVPTFASDPDWRWLTNHTSCKF